MNWGKSVKTANAGRPGWKTVFYNYFSWYNLSGWVGNALIVTFLHSLKARVTLTQTMYIKLLRSSFVLMQAAIKSLIVFSIWIAMYKPIMTVNYPTFLWTSFNHWESNSFECETCGKSFGRKDKLQRHVKIHSAARIKCGNQGCMFDCPSNCVTYLVFRITAIWCKTDKLRQHQKGCALKTPEQRQDKKRLSKGG